MADAAGASPAPPASRQTTRSRRCRPPPGSTRRPGGPPGLLVDPGGGRHRRLLVVCRDAGGAGDAPAASAIPPTTAVDRPAAHTGGRINGPLLGSPKAVLVCPGNASGRGGAANCAENALAGSRGARAPPMNL